MNKCSVVIHDITRCYLVQDENICRCGQQVHRNFLFFISLVYDTSNRESFNKLEEWLNEVEVYSTKRDIIKMLVGNKIDKVSKSNYI